LAGAHEPTPGCEPTLFVISGTQGAGKSTVARLLARRFERGACVSADLLQKMIVSGGRWPEGATMSEDAERQLRLRLHHACLLGRSFVAAGITAVIDDIVIGSRLDHLLEELAGHAFVFVMLTPTLEAVRRREQGRGTELWKAWEWLDDEIRHRTRRVGLWLDTSDQTPEQTVDAILARARPDGLVTAPPLLPSHAMSERLTAGGYRRQHFRAQVFELAASFRAGRISFMQLAPAIVSAASAFADTHGPYYDSPVYGQAMELEIRYAMMLDQGQDRLTDDELAMVNGDLDILLDMISHEPGYELPPDQTVTLYRPVGPQELALIEQSGWRAFPPRLPEQPIFYPVTNEPYAVKIARDWNSTSEQNGFAGFVTRFAVRASFLAGYRVEQVGTREHREYWIPAEELDLFNANIVGQIEVIGEYRHGERVDHPT
jgi:predicted kinase